MFVKDKRTTIITITSFIILRIKMYTILIRPEQNKISFTDTVFKIKSAFYKSIF